VTFVVRGENNGVRSEGEISDIKLIKRTGGLLLNNQKMNSPPPRLPYRGTLWFTLPAFASLLRIGSRLLTQTEGVSVLCISLSKTHTEKSIINQCREAGNVGLWRRRRMKIS